MLESFLPDSPSLWGTIKFVAQWWWIIGIGIGVMVLLPGVLPMLVKFFTETALGRTIAIVFLGLWGIVFVVLSIFNAGKAEAYREQLVQTKAKLKASPPRPPPKQHTDWFKIGKR